jgi:hypothetical protein
MIYFGTKFISEPTKLRELSGNSVRQWISRARECTGWDRKETANKKTPPYGE